MSAYLNALREEGTRDDLLREVERQKARAERAGAERDEAQAHARNHHLEACESCAAMQGERDIAEANAAALREALGEALHYVTNLADLGGLDDSGLAAMARRETDRGWPVSAFSVALQLRQALAANDAGAALLAELEALRRLPREYLDSNGHERCCACDAVLRRRGKPDEHGANCYLVALSEATR